MYPKRIIKSYLHNNKKLLNKKTSDHKSETNTQSKITYSKIRDKTSDHKSVFMCCFLACLHKLFEIAFENNLLLIYKYFDIF